MAVPDIDPRIKFPEPTHPDPGYCEGCGPNCAHCLKPGPHLNDNGTPFTTWDQFEGGWQCAADNAAHLAYLEGGSY